MRPFVTTHPRVALESFQLLLTPAGRYSAPPGPEAWDEAIPCAVPGTVAGALARAGRLELSAPPDLDAHDAWLRVRLPETLPESARHLAFEGLATLCDVWLEGEHLLHSENMFVRHSVESARPLRPGMELTLRCGALAPRLAQRRGRPRYRTRLVESQELRWLRTSLLGRTPGNGPRLPALGAYRPIYVESCPRFRLGEHSLRTRVRGTRAELELALTLALDEPDSKLRATLLLSGEAASGRFPLTLTPRPDGVRAELTCELSEVALWWPHTHGPQPRCRAQLELGFGSSAATALVELGQIGFRALTVERGADGAGFQLRVNDVPVFCRGACWSADDIVDWSSARVHQTLAQARAAGMNMLRVGGTTSYESDAFYEACDALGILVFQDFMFANLDYPAGDAGFMAEVEREVDQQLTRLQGRPSIALLCGGSEVEQQVAMLGLTAEPSPLFQGLLPERARAHLPDVPYVPNSPTGGAQPFQVDAGLAHYYGVGAYLRPLGDARLSAVRFAAECLAFANVPRTAAIEALLGDLEMPFHHPRWKERVPRDRGAGWDFEDVRDHYLEQLYGADARRLRGSDPERYLHWSRAVVVDVMEATMTELRRVGSPCSGALVWTLKDLWLGAGFGVIDAAGAPKSAYYALRRAFAPLLLGFTDEGMNGPALSLQHDGAEALDVMLSVALYRAGETELCRAERALRLAPRSGQALRVDALFDRFLDVGYVYRFGPVSHDLIVAELTGADGSLLARACALPVSSAVQLDEPGLEGTLEARDGQLGLTLRTRRFARRVEIEIEPASVLPDDNFFHLPPGATLWVPLRRAPEGTPLAPADAASLRVGLRALNQRLPVQPVRAARLA